MERSEKFKLNQERDLVEVGKVKKWKIKILQKPMREENECETQGLF